MKRKKELHRIKEVPMILKTVLILKNRRTADGIKALLKKYKRFIEVRDQADNLPEGLCKINGQKPDLLFLDLRLGLADTRLFLKQLNHIPLIEFLTPCDRQLLRALRIASLGYLLLPLSPFTLNHKIERIKELFDIYRYKDDEVPRLQEKVKKKILSKEQKKIDIFLTLTEDEEPEEAKILPKVLY